MCHSLIDAIVQDDCEGSNEANSIVRCPQPRMDCAAHRRQVPHVTSQLQHKHKYDECVQHNHIRGATNSETVIDTAVIDAIKQRYM